MSKFKMFLFLVAAVTPACCFAGADDIVVVVNKSNPIDNVTSAQLKKLILGQQSSWSAGKKVSVVLRAPGQPEREGVLRSGCGMSESDYNQFTMHADLNGETLGEPKVLSSAAAVRQLVGTNPGAIGFLRVTDMNDTVKAIAVDGTGAGQSGYRIKSGK